MTTEPATLPSQPNPSVQAIRGFRETAWLAGGVLVLLWAYAVYRLGTLWHSNADYAYGWFVPLLCLALFWERWKTRPPRDPLGVSTGPMILWGLLALTLMPSCLFLEVIPAWRFAGWAFAGAVIGITFCALYLIGGRCWVHHFAFAVLFFVIAVPWPTRLEVPLITKLSHLNAALSTWAVNWLGTPAIRNGVVIQTGAGMVGIDEACSGIRSFQAAVMVALFLGELFRYGLFRRLFLLLCGAGLAFGCNVVRTSYLVRVCDQKGKAAVNLYHDPAGFTILGITLAGLLVLTWLFRPRKSPEAQPASKDQPESAAELEVKSRWSEGVTQPSGVAVEPRAERGRQGESRQSNVGLTAALVCTLLWVLAVEVEIEVWFRPTENRAASKGTWSLQWPTQQPGFLQPPIADSVRNMLKYDEGTRAEWREANGRPWQVYYLRWLPAHSRYRAVDASEQAQGHRPDVCLELAGMALQKNFGSQLRQIKGVSVLTNLEKFSDRGRPLHVMTCYWEPDAASLGYQPANPPSTANALRNAWHALQTHDRGRNEKCVVKIAVWGMETDEEAEAAINEFLQRAVRT
jgi:exosortase